MPPEMSMKDKEMRAVIEAASVYPGFRFSPTDEELVSFYLKKKLQGSEKSVGVIAEVEINKFEPWDLPAKSIIQSDSEWFFFSPRGRKYPNGSQSKRATESGYWKATGKERNLKSGSNIIGTKRALVFHTGRAPKGKRTEWLMHEYSMAGKSDKDSLVICRLRRNNDFMLNDSPWQSSSNQIHASAESIGNRCMSIMGVESPGIMEGSKAVESSPKDHSNSYDSDSVEQLNSGMEYETNGYSQFDVSSQQISEFHVPIQDNEYEDCFADILKDDIIDLGKPLQMLPPLHEDAHLKIRPNRRTEPVLLESTNEDRVKKIQNQRPAPSCVVSFLYHRSLLDRSLYILGSLVTMLVLSMCRFGVYQAKLQGLCISFSISIHHSVTSVELGVKSLGFVLACFLDVLYKLD